MLALLVFALAATDPAPPPYQPASAEECRVIDAAVGSTPAATVAVPPEQIVALTDPKAATVYGAGRPPIARGQAGADISHCLRANRPFDPLPGSDTATIISRATIDAASGRAAILYDHRCGVGGVIRLTRDRNGDWIRTARKQMWTHACPPPPETRPRP